MTFKIILQGFPDGASVKKLPANVGDERDAGSILGLGRCPGRGLGNPLQYSFFFFHSSILAWRIPWMEEPGRLQSMGLQRVRHN